MLIQELSSLYVEVLQHCIIIQITMSCPCKGAVYQRSRASIFMPNDVIAFCKLHFQTPSRTMIAAITNRNPPQNVFHRRPRSGNRRALPLSTRLNTAQSTLSLRPQDGAQCRILTPHPRTPPRPPLRCPICVLETRSICEIRCDRVTGRDSRCWSFRHSG